MADIFQDISLSGQARIIIGQLPSLPIPKGNAGPSLLSHVLIGKYVDHLPLYRQQQQFTRLGVDIFDKTIGGWFDASIYQSMGFYSNDCGR